LGIRNGIAAIKTHPQLSPKKANQTELEIGQACITAKDN